MRAAFLVMLLALLSGCERRLPGKPELFPLDAGLRWTYRQTTELSDGSRTEARFTVENLGTTALADGLEAQERRNSLGNHYWFVADGAGIYRVAARSEIEDRARYDEESPRRWVIKAPFRPGTTWQIRTWPYLLKKPLDWPQEQRHGKPVLMTVEIEAVDAEVEVPAGKFSKCVVVAGRHDMRLYADPAAGWMDVPIVQREWFCPGAGMVKQVRTERVKSKYVQGGEVTFELEEGPG